MKITMYELLGLVKDGKAPKTIKSEGHYYKYNELEKDYYEGMGYDYEYLLANTSVKGLNDEVEILEEEKKIPEKLTDILRIDDLIPPVDENMYKIWTQTIKNHNKINEICDYLKSKGE